MIRLILISTLLALASPALADAPASIPETGQERAENAFDEFARQWMKKVHSLEAENRKNPTVKRGSTSPVVTYRGYGDDYSVELRPTGQPSAPYVGLLRYTEHVYSCTDMKARDCRIASTVPVTEIFRYQNGRWSY